MNWRTIDFVKRWRNTSRKKRKKAKRADIMAKEKARAKKVEKKARAAQPKSDRRSGRITTPSERFRLSRCQIQMQSNLPVRHTGRAKPMVLLPHTSLFLSQVIEPAQAVMRSQLILKRSESW